MCPHDRAVKQGVQQKCGQAMEGTVSYDLGDLEHVNEASDHYRTWLLFRLDNHEVPNVSSACSADVPSRLIEYSCLD